VLVLDLVRPAVQSVAREAARSGEAPVPLRRFKNIGRMRLRTEIDVESRRMHAMKSEKRVVEVPGLFDSQARGYAQAVTAGGLVFVAGQIGVDDGLELVSLEFAAQARQALMNVRLALEAAGSDLTDVTAMTVHLTDIRYLQAFAGVRREVMGDVLAASTTVEVSALAIPGALVEVTVVAVR
jgi:2-iminobutanoate/2-iminopropanoate deaminase